MLQYTLIPTLLITLINICVVVYVFQLGDRRRSAFFLLVNALALVIWAGGRTLYEALGEDSPIILSLPQVASLLVPANFLYYALSRPRPIRPMADSPIVLFCIFLPAILLALAEDYSGSADLLFDYRFAVEDFTFGARTTRGAVLFCIFCFSLSLAVLSIRYNTSSGPDKTVAKHLVAVIAGPLFFAGFFWAASQQADGVTIIPSPSLILVLMAQAGLIVVLRQEELLGKRLLTRILYYLAALLAAVLLVILLSEFYTLRAGRIVLDRTVGWLMIGVALLVLVLTRLRPVETILDRLVFERASEYRKIVEETREELRNARERLRRAERLSVVGELSARVAHEIKNPLGPIKGYTQMMREKIEEDPAFPHRERFLRYLEVIAEEAESIDRRIRQFLDSARMTSMMIEDVNVNHLVERCARLMEMEAAAQVELEGDSLPVRIIFRGDPSLGSIRADPARLEEAVFNLARNSLEALRGTPRAMMSLTTRTRPGPDGTDGVEILIEDNGPGFPSDHTDIFFEPFISNKAGGTGLGLSIVQSFIAAHGGNVAIRNRESGGSRAIIWLPLEARENPGALLPKGG